MSELYIYQTARCNDEKKIASEYWGVIKKEDKLTVQSQLYLSAIMSYMFRLYVPTIIRLNTNHKQENKTVTQSRKKYLGRDLMMAIYSRNGSWALFIDTVIFGLKFIFSFIFVYIWTQRGCLVWKNEDSGVVWRHAVKFVYDDMMIYLSNAIELIPGGSSTVHIYTQTVHRTTQVTTEQYK